MVSFMRNIGAYLKCLVAAAGTALAAGAGDATKVTGQSIDRRDYGSGVLNIAYTATLAEDKTIAFAAEYQESADGSTWDTAVAMQASTVDATGGSGGSTEVGEVEIDIELENKKRYIRFNITPDLSNTATDVCHWGATCVLGGARERPAT